MYPKIIFHSQKYKHNVKKMKDLLTKDGKTLTVVTKVFSATPEIAATVEEIADFFGDSRIENIIRLKNRKIPKILMRLPMHSEVEQVVLYADISFNSELSTLVKLNEAAKKANKIHKVVLMKDVGDLREGCFENEELLKLCQQVLTMDHLELYGLGMNLTCFGAILPSEENTKIFTDTVRWIEETLPIQLKMITGGNSSSLSLLQEGKLSAAINNLRLGDVLVSGCETAYGERIEDLHTDVFTLECEIIEMKDKPSVPIGTSGKDAFGNIPEFEDLGIRKKAIVAIGKQDIYTDSIQPSDNRIQILGASSDHLILDMTQCQEDYQVGSTVQFHLEYSSILKGFTSEYIKKEFQ